MSFVRVPRKRKPITCRALSPHTSRWERWRVYYIAKADTMTNTHKNKSMFSAQFGEPCAQPDKMSSTMSHTNICFTRAALNHDMQASHSSDRALEDRCAEGRNVCASRQNMSNIMPSTTYAVKRREDEIISDKKLLHQKFRYNCFQHYYWQAFISTLL